MKVESIVMINWDHPVLRC